MVRPAAVICPHCRSRLGGGAPLDAYRNRPGRQLAGVAVALAESIGVSVTLVRLTFIVATFVSFIGPAVYVTFWLLLPADRGGSSPLSRVVEAVAGAADGEASLLERLVRRARGLADNVIAWFKSKRRLEGDGSSEPTPANGSERP